MNCANFPYSLKQIMRALEFQRKNLIISFFSLCSHLCVSTNFVCFDPYLVRPQGMLDPLLGQSPISGRSAGKLLR